MRSLHSFFFSQLEDMSVHTYKTNAHGTWVCMPSPLPTPPPPNPSFSLFLVLQRGLRVRWTQSYSRNLACFLAIFFAQWPEFPGQKIKLCLAREPVSVARWLIRAWPLNLPEPQLVSLQLTHQLLPGFARFQAPKRRVVAMKFYAENQPMFICYSFVHDNRIWQPVYLSPFVISYLLQTLIPVSSRGLAASIYVL